jgi:hypothetical protein
MPSPSMPEPTCDGIGCNCYPNGHCGPPPATATYPDIDTAFQAIEAHARINGYAVYIRDKQPPKPRPTTRVTVCCDKGPDGYRDNKDPNVHETKRRKNTGSKKCGCKFRVEIKLDKKLSIAADSQVWRVKDMGNEHNHGRSSALSAHPQYRLGQCLSETRASIIAAAQAGQSNAEIMATLQQIDPTFNLISKDISNLLQEARRIELGGQSPIQWLLKVSFINFYLYINLQVIGTPRKRF